MSAVTGTDYNVAEEAWIDRRARQLERTHGIAYSYAREVAETELAHKPDDWTPINGGTRTGRD